MSAETIPAQTMEGKLAAFVAPIITTPKSYLLSELPSVEDDTHNELLRNRFLCRGGMMLLQGPTGCGKSSLSMQAMISWALGRDFFGIPPARPLRSLIIQAENDAGDLGRMRDGILDGMNLTPSEREQAMSSVRVHDCNDKASKEFFDHVVSPLLCEHPVDLLWIDPALSYIGGESSSQKDVSLFLRNGGLLTILAEHQCGGVVAHHIGKPKTEQGDASLKLYESPYYGHGSVEWANAARAILNLSECGNGYFRLTAAKRHQQLDWTDADGNFIKTRIIAQSGDRKKIFWRTPSFDEAQATTSKVGRPKNHDDNEVVALVDTDGGLSHADFRSRAVETLGIPKGSFQAIRLRLTKEHRIAKTPEGKWIKCGRIKLVSKVSKVSTPNNNPDGIIMPQSLDSGNTDTNTDTEQRQAA